ncbi:MAG: hypothetical protein WCH40_01900 [Verrucomicrobiales bacterium]
MIGLREGDFFPVGRNGRVGPRGDLPPDNLSAGEIRNANVAVRLEGDDLSTCQSLAEQYEA